MNYLVKKNPDPQTHANVSPYTGGPVPNGFEVMTQAELELFLETNVLPAVPFVLDIRPYELAILARLDAVAYSWDFKSPEATQEGAMVSARTYAGYPNAFQAEAVALGAWCAQVWQFVAMAQAQASSAGGPLPTPEQFADFVIASVPPPVRPS